MILPLAYLYGHSLLDSGSHKLNNSSHFSLSCLEGSMVDRQAPREPHSVTSDPYC